MLTHECRGETLHLHAERALFWPRRRMLIVADVHLGKAAAFRSHGIPIPRGTTQKNLQRLTALIEFYRPEQLLVLGDLVHAREGYVPELIADVAAWRRKHSKCRWLVVPGNHDCRAGDFPAEWNLEVHASGLDVSPFRFLHHPSDDAGGGYVLAGHLHPCAVLQEGGRQRWRVPCFWFGEKCAVLPAFGDFTGMHPIEPRSTDAVFAVGETVQRVRIEPVTTRRSRR